MPIADAPPRSDIDVNQWAPGNFGVISLHPDGRQIAFLTGQVNSEMWVLEKLSAGARRESALMECAGKGTGDGLTTVPRQSSH